MEARDNVRRALAFRVRYLRTLPLALCLPPSPSALAPSPSFAPSRPLCAAVTGHPARYERSPYLLSPPRDIELRGGAGEDRECSRKGSANLMQFRGRLEGLGSPSPSRIMTPARRKLRRRVFFSGRGDDTFSNNIDARSEGRISSNNVRGIAGRWSSAMSFLSARRIFVSLVDCDEILFV